MTVYPFSIAFSPSSIGAPNERTVLVHRDNLRILYPYGRRGSVEGSMKLLTLLAALLLLAGCGDVDIIKNGGKKYDVDALYIKDASGRCLVISTSVTVLNPPADGSLRVYVIPEGQPCAPAK